MVLNRISINIIIKTFDVLWIRKDSTVHVGHLQLFKPEFLFQLQHNMLKTAVNHLNNIMAYPSSKSKKVAIKRILLHSTCRVATWET